MGKVEGKGKEENCGKRDGKEEEKGKKGKEDNCGKRDEKEEEKRKKGLGEEEEGTV